MSSRYDLGTRHWEALTRSRGPEKPLLLAMAVMPLRVDWFDPNIRLQTSDTGRGGMFAGPDEPGDGSSASSRNRISDSSAPTSDGPDRNWMPPVSTGVD